MVKIDTKKVRQFITKMRVADLKKLVAQYNKQVRLKITSKKKADIIEEIMTQKEHHPFRAGIHAKIIKSMTKKDEPKKKMSKPKVEPKEKTEPKKKEVKKVEPKKKSIRQLREEYLYLRSFLKNIVGMTHLVKKKENFPNDYELNEEELKERIQRLKKYKKNLDKWEDMDKDDRINYKDLLGHFLKGYQKKAEPKKKEVKKVEPKNKEVKKVELKNKEEPKKKKLSSRTRAFKERLKKRKIKRDKLSCDEEGEIAKKMLKYINGDKKLYRNDDELKLDYQKCINILKSLDEKKQNCDEEQIINEAVSAYQAVKNKSQTVNLLEMEILEDVLHMIEKENLSKKIVFETTHFNVFLFFVELLKRHKNDCIFIADNSKLTNEENLGIVIHYYNNSITLPNKNNFFRLIKECKKKNHFAIVPIFIKMSDGGHLNMLVYNPYLDQFEHYEPHGNRYDANIENKKDSVDFGHIYKKLNHMLKGSITKNTHYLSPNETFTGKVGLQAIEASYTSKGQTIGDVFIPDPGGFCVVWSFYLANTRLSNPQLSAKQVYDKALLNVSGQKFKEGHVTDRIIKQKRFKNFVREYALIRLRVLKKFKLKFESKIKRSDKDSQKWWDDYYKKNNIDPNYKIESEDYILKTLFNELKNNAHLQEVK